MIKKYFDFETVAEKCPWRTGLRCLVLQTAEKYKVLGEAGCGEKNCAIWQMLKTQLSK